jgi:hypothetical protein
VDYDDFYHFLPSTSPFFVGLIAVLALSRGVSQNSTKVLIKEGKIEGEDEDFTKNVVFKDILLSQSYQCFFYITCHLYMNNAECPEPELPESFPRDLAIIIRQILCCK